MTNYERIKNMTVEEMAEFNIVFFSDDMREGYETSDGEFFYIKFGEENTGKAWNEAIKHEIEWLNSECEAVYDERKGEGRDVDEHNKVRLL